MNSKTPQQTENKIRSAVSRILPGTRRCGRKLLHALAARRVVVVFLVAVVATELVILGVGVTRRLDMAYEHSLEVSRAQLAVIEARELAQLGLENQGAAGIAAPGTPTPAQNDEEVPPPLRVRDVDTILLQEGGFDFEDMGAETTQAAPPSPAEEEAVSKLSKDDREELDSLIRQGVTAMIAGDMRQCVLCLEEASIISPEHPAMLYYYGMAYDKLMNPKKAREYFTKVFQMRDRAGNYFKRAAHRLTYGFDQASALRGKLSFGPYQLKHTYTPDEGETLNMKLPVLLAPGEEVRMDDLYIHIQFFDIINGRRIAFSRGKVDWAWHNEKPNWHESEENLEVSYSLPPLTQEEQRSYGDVKYYGFTAKLYYKGEPLDCVSAPSALVLHEQRLNTRAQRHYSTPPNSLLPDDGLVPAYEDAMPVSDFLPELPLPQ